MKKSYVGCEVVANHKSSNDTEYQRIHGVVVSQQSVVGDDKGMVLVIQTEWKGSFLRGTRTICQQSVYHTVYFDKVVGIMRVINRPVEYTGKGEPCDAVSDSMLGGR